MDVAIRNLISTINCNRKFHVIEFERLDNVLYFPALIEPTERGQKTSAL